MPPVRGRPAARAATIGYVVERLQKTAPGVLDLACALSLAARIERELVRWMRLQLAEQAYCARMDVETELALWFSDLVSWRSEDSIVFHDSAYKALRALLETRGALLEASRRVLLEAHRGAAPITLWEEELIYVGLDVNGQERAARFMDRVHAVGNAAASGRRPRLGTLVREAVNRMPAFVELADAQRLLRTLTETLQVPHTGQLGVLTRPGAIELLPEGAGGQLMPLSAEPHPTLRLRGYKSVGAGAALHPSSQIFESTEHWLGQRTMVELPPECTYVSLSCGDGNVYGVPVAPRSPRDGYLGARLETGGCSFRLWAPNAARVALEFVGSRHATLPMSRNADGYWHAFQTGVAAGQEYRYLLDQTWQCDPASRGWSAQGNSVVEDPAFAWRPFKAPARDDLVIYSLHVASFVEPDATLNDDSDGRLRALAQRLDHVRSLGFNAICLLPVQKSHDPSGLGFDPMHPFALEPFLGRPSDLRHLVDHAHALGLAVFPTVVYSHMSTGGNSLWGFDRGKHEAGIYFEDGGDTPWGPSFAWWKAEVREYLYQNARMWFEEYNVDGLNIDTVERIPSSFLRELLQRLGAEFPARPIVGEAFTDAARSEATGLDATLRLDACAQMTRALEGDGQIEGVLSLLHWEPSTKPASMIAATGTHDDVGPAEGGRGRYLVERLGGRVSWLARAKCRLAWALNATLPGVPWMFMGTEVHLGSPELVMGSWNPSLSGAGGGFDWSVLEQREAQEMMQLVRSVNQLRAACPELRGEDYEVTHTDRRNHVVAFKRWVDGGRVVLVIVNLSDRSFERRTYGVRTGKQFGRWQERLCTQDPKFGGWQGAGNALVGPHELWTQPDELLYVNVPKWSLVCLQLTR